MTINERLIERANSIAFEGEDAEAVIARALANLAWERQEVAAVQEGVDAYQEGRHRPAQDFFDEFFGELGLPPQA